MIFHHDELDLARRYERTAPFEGLTEAQMRSIMDRGRALHKWFKEHHTLHCAINIGVLLFLFAADAAALLWLPGIFLRGPGEESWWRILTAAALSGGLHSYLMYSLNVFSLHEGAAHKVIFPPRGPFTRALNFFSCNLCRIAAGEPYFYTEHHMAHHAKFGTEGDGEFLNFVRPRRYWLTFLPFAAFINFSDFVIHRPPHYTRSRILSAILSIAFNGAWAVVLWDRWGAPFTLVAMVVFLPHVGFYLDRLRQFTEHNLMPLENKNGSRSFGFGFWGMLVGGGPWGSPCHWEHHLVASLPWYQQLILHSHVTALLTPEQRKQFLIEPVIGFPKLWFRLIRESQVFASRAK